MVWMIIGFLVSVIWFFARKTYNKHEEDWLSQVLASLILAIFGFLVGVMVASVIGIFLPKHFVETEAAELVSLRNNDGAHGIFFLGIGSVESTEYYFYYEKDGRGYRPRKLKVDDNDIIVFEEERLGGTLKGYSEQFKNKSAKWFAFNGNPSHKYEFYIPEGSLRKDFVLQ